MALACFRRMLIAAGITKGAPLPLADFSASTLALWEKIEVSCQSQKAITFVLVVLIVLHLHTDQSHTRWVYRWCALCLLGAPSWRFYLVTRLVSLANYEPLDLCSACLLATCLLSLHAAEHQLFSDIEPGGLANATEHVACLKSGYQCKGQQQGHVEERARCIFNIIWR